MSRQAGNTLVGVLLAGAAALGCAPPAPPGPSKAPEVDVAQAVEQEVTDYEVFTGSVQAEKFVDLRAQVTGYLLAEPLVREGTDVKAGEILFKIDPSMYEAALAQAKANTNSANTRVQTAQDTYQRDLATPSATTDQTMVQDRDALAEAKAALKAAQAAEQAAQINVNFTDIKAPFAGRVSRRNVDPGNLVQQNLTSLATVAQLDPIYAYFDVDERTLLRIRKLVEQGDVRPESLKGKGLPVNLALSDETGFAFTPQDEKRDSRQKADTPRHPGYVRVVDNQENVQTGTLRMWGEFQNPAMPSAAGDNPAPRLLSPGMFARIQLPIGPPHKAVLVAEAALVNDQGRQLLYVVGPPDEKGECEVRAQEVTLGSYQEGLRVIQTELQPLQPDEKVKVVMNGLQRVRDKGKVRVRKVVPMRPGERAAEAGGQGDTGGANR
jgi:RND family efflux transporter MFP subunit